MYNLIGNLIFRPLFDIRSDSGSSPIFDSSSDSWTGGSENGTEGKGRKGYTTGESGFRKLVTKALFIIFKGIIAL